MSKEFLNDTPADLYETIELDGQSIEVLVGDVRCVKATPNTGGTPKIWLFFHRSGSSESYIWNAPIDDFNEQIELDPGAESRWVAE